MEFTNITEEFVNGLSCTVYWFVRESEQYLEENVDLINLGKFKILHECGDMYAIATSSSDNHLAKESLN